MWQYLKWNCSTAERTVMHNISYNTQTTDTSIHTQCEKRKCTYLRRHVGTTELWQNWLWRHDIRALWLNRLRAAIYSQHVHHTHWLITASISCDKQCCLRHIPCVLFLDWCSNADIRQSTEGNPPLADIKARRLRLFSHLARAEPFHWLRPHSTFTNICDDEWLELPTPEAKENVAADYWIGPATTGLLSAWWRAQDHHVWRHIMETAVL